MTDATDYVDESGVHFDSYRDWVVGGAWGLCGCVDSDIEDDLLAVLEHFRASEKGYAWFEDLPVEGPNKYRELLLHMIDQLGWIEHGGSIRGSWLTPAGLEVAERLHNSYIGPTQRGVPTPSL